MTAKTADYFRQTEKVITTKRTTLVKSKKENSSTIITKF